MPSSDMCVLGCTVQSRLHSYPCVLRGYSERQLPTNITTFKPHKSASGIARAARQSELLPIGVSLRGCWHATPAHPLLLTTQGRVFGCCLPHALASTLLDSSSTIQQPAWLSIAEPTPCMQKYTCTSARPPAVVAAGLPGLLQHPLKGAGQSLPTQ
jgi:hypothetical protein